MTWNSFSKLTSINTVRALGQLQLVTACSVMELRFIVPSLVILNKMQLELCNRSYDDLLLFLLMLDWQ